MAVVRGDRIAESKKLNLCSFAAHVAYGTFVGCVPDDFGRFRATPTAIAERMFPRREVDRRRIEREIGGWLKEWAEDRGAGPLILLWQVDGVQWGELTGWGRRSGNLYHRTPEPPWSKHVHNGRCGTTALARAKEWGTAAEVEALTLRLRELREQRSNRNATGGVAEPEHPSLPSLPSLPSPPSPPSEITAGTATAPAAPAGRSNEREPITDGTAAEIERLSAELARLCPSVSAEEWTVQASRIEGDAHRPPKAGFRRPREPGVPEPWARTTVRKLTELLEQQRRPLPL